MGPQGAADPPSGTAGRVHPPPPPEDIPSSSAWHVSAAPAARAALPPSEIAVVAQPDAKTGDTGYPADAPAIAVLPMLRVQPLFAWNLELPGQKRARVEFLAAMSELDIQTQAGEETPPLRISFRGIVIMASGAVEGRGAARGAVCAPVAGGGGALENADGRSGEAGGG